MLFFTIDEQHQINTQLQAERHYRRESHVCACIFLSTSEPQNAVANSIAMFSIPSSEYLVQSVSISQESKLLSSFFGRGQHYGFQLIDRTIVIRMCELQGWDEELSPHCLKVRMNPREKLIRLGKLNRRVPEASRSRSGYQALGQPKLAGRWTSVSTD